MFNSSKELALSTSSLVLFLQELGKVCLIGEPSDSLLHSSGTVLIGMLGTMTRFLFGNSNSDKKLLFGEAG